MPRKNHQQQSVTNYVKKRLKGKGFKKGARGKAVKYKNYISSPNPGFLKENLQQRLHRGKQVHHWVEYWSMRMAYCKESGSLKLMEKSKNAKMNGFAKKLVDALWYPHRIVPTSVETSVKTGNKLRGRMDMAGYTVGNSHDQTTPCVIEVKSTESRHTIEEATLQAQVYAQGMREETGVRHRAFIVIVKRHSIECREVTRSISQGDVYRPRKRHSQKKGGKVPSSGR